MKIQLGDTVEIIDSKYRGIVIKILDNTLIINIDGFDLEVNIEDVVLLKTDPSKKIISPPKEIQTELKDGIYLVIDIQEHWVDIHLLNHQFCNLHFVAISDLKNKQYLKDGIVEPFKIQKLKTVSENNFVRDAKLELQFLSCFTNTPEKNQFTTYLFEPTSKILNRKSQFIKVLQKEAIAYPLEQKPNPTKVGKIPLYIKKTVEEIPEISLTLEAEKTFDLHLEKLTDKPYQIPEHQRLDFQLKKAEEFLYHALMSKCERVIFIHGGGKGKLKEALIQLFSNHPNIAEYGVADIQKHGLGATFFKLKYS